MRKFIGKAIILFVTLLLLGCSSVRIAPSYDSSRNSGVRRTSSISEGTKTTKKTTKKVVKKAKKEDKKENRKEEKKPEVKEEEPEDNLPETIEEPVQEKTVEKTEKKEEFLKEDDFVQEQEEEAVTDEASENDIFEGDDLKNPVKLEKPVKETKYEKALRKAKEKELKEQKKAEAKKLKHQKKDPYTGWLYVPKRNFTVKKGDIQLTLRGSAGTFGIYAIPESGSKRPLLTTSDDFSSTYFSVRAGRQEYQLNRESGVSCEARETDYGAQLAYKVKNKFQFVADFSLMPSIATSSRIDVIRVTLYTTNLSRNTQSFTAKAVFDTMLGENTYQHFSTAARSRINSETQYTDMSVDRWIRSSNDRAAIQFLLNGKGITKPKSVTLANKDLLSAQASWELAARDQRSFSSVLAYNNSAMGINWRTAYLDPLKTDVITFYISVSTDDREPAGREFLNNLERGKTALPSAIPESAILSDVPSQTVEVTPEETQTEFHDNMPVISGDPEAVIKAGDDDNLIIPATSPAAGTSSASTAEEAEPLQPKTENLISAVPVNLEESEPEPVADIPQEKIDDTARLGTVPEQKTEEQQKQFDPEYIQDLLDRIAELENDTALVDRAEIDRLNAELDMILSELRSME